MVEKEHSSPITVQLYDWQNLRNKPEKQSAIIQAYVRSFELSHWGEQHDEMVVAERIEHDLTIGAFGCLGTVEQGNIILAAGWEGGKVDTLQHMIDWLLTTYEQTEQTTIPDIEANRIRSDIQEYFAIRNIDVAQVMNVVDFFVVPERRKTRDIIRLMSGMASKADEGEIVHYLVWTKDDPNLEMYRLMMSRGADVISTYKHYDSEFKFIIGPVEGIMGKFRNKIDKL